MDIPRSLSEWMPWWGGLLPHKMLGPILRTGWKYTLENLPGWTDAKRHGLIEGFGNTFLAGVKDEVPPDPAGWERHRPKAETRDPFVLQFFEP